MKHLAPIFLWILAPIFTEGQTLLESYVASDSSGLQTGLNGFIRGVSYIGLTPAPSKLESKSLYGEAALKMNSSFQGWGKGVAEIRARKGYEFGSDIDMFSLREGYVELYAGKFELAFGQQIIVWGKADGINPTNQITPVNTILRTPDIDDSRMGNVLLTMRYHIASAWILDALWIPLYKPSVLPWQFASLPEGTDFVEGPYPDAKIENSGLALKISLQYPGFDASLSFNTGYGLNPGITADMTALPSPPESIPLIYTAAYRNQIVGFDFSTTLGSVGIRGEAAYRVPDSDYNDKIEIPNPDIYYVFGMDHFFGPVHVIAQYIGRHVIDFADIRPPADSLDMMRYALEEGNRLFQMQQAEWSHGLSLRAAVDLLYERMTAEVFGMANFTTDEYLLVPRLNYKISDGLSLCMGMEYYSGGENTLFNIVEDHFNSVFFEMKAIF